MEGFEGFVLEVDSVADLQVPVLDESSVEEWVVEHQLATRSTARSIAGSFLGIKIASTPASPAVANAWHRELSGQNGRAGIVGRCEHAVWDGWNAEVAGGFGFLTGSVSVSSVKASATGHYRISEHIVVAPSDCLPASIHVPVSVTPCGVPAR